MEQPIVTILVSVITSAVLSIFIHRIRFERFEAMDQQREEDWSTWRQSISDNVRELERAASKSDMAVLANRLEEVSRRISEVERRVYGRPSEQSERR